MTKKFIELCWKDSGGKERFSYFENFNQLNKFMSDMGQGEVSIQYISQVEDNATLYYEEG